MGERFLAFIDVLGFKYIVEKTDKASHIMNTLEEVKRKTEKIAMENETAGMEVTWFSDSIVISYPACDPYNLVYLLEDVQEMQRQLILDKIIIRGGIDVNQCYHKEDFLYGVAMNKAYELESIKAIVPRVIVSNNIVKYLEKIDMDEKENLKCELELGIDNNDEQLQYIKDLYIGGVTTTQGIKADLIKKDKDGIYFVDYLTNIIKYCVDGGVEGSSKYHKTDAKIDLLFKAMQEVYNDIYSDWIKPIQDLIKSNMENQPLGVMLKYMWLKDYFNSIVESKRYLMNDEFIDHFYAKLIINS